MQIRTARSGDLEEIQAIFRSFVAFHAALDDSFAKISGHEHMFAEYVQSLMDREDAHVLVADENGSVAGYMLGIIQHKPPVYLKPDFGFIDSTAVRDDCQRRGIGALMFQSMREWFREQGTERIELYAALMNPKSTSFWRKMGFAPYMETLYTSI